MDPKDFQFNQVNSRAHYWKFVTGFLVIVVIVFAALWGLARYERYTGEQQVHQLAEAMKELERSDYNAAMADTYGGKTPKETLQLYIAALEKRDFSLAAQYFIGDYKEKENKRWNGVKNDEVAQAILVLKQALDKEGSYSGDGKGFAIRRPILIDMKQYPNGIWKLIEI